MSAGLFVRRREERVVGTSTPGDWCKPGTLYQWRDGHPWYRITRVVRAAPTRLLNGGTVPHFTVYGVPAPPPERPVEYHAKSTLFLGDLGPGESVRVPLDVLPGLRIVVRADPNPMPRFSLFRRADR